MCMERGLRIRGMVERETVEGGGAVCVRGGGARACLFCARACVGVRVHVRVCGGRCVERGLRREAQSGRRAEGGAEWEARGGRCAVFA